MCIQTAHVNNKNGKALKTEREHAERWVQHFKEVLNCPEPDFIATPEPSEDDLNINTEPSTIDEVRNTIKSLKTGKAPGIDSIQAEMLKADLDTSSKVLHILFLVIWEEGDIPSDWSKGLIVKLPKKGNLRNCDNWRGITLLAVPSKVFTKFFLKELIKLWMKSLKKNKQALEEAEDALTKFSL